MPRINLKFLLALLGLLLACNSPQPRLLKHVTFRIIPQVMPDSAAVYIAGNHPQLGLWRPDTIRLALQADSSWSRTFEFHAGVRLEYKITRGSWQNEAVNAEGIVLPNAVLEVTNDTTVTITIANWKDFRHTVEGQITGTVAYHRQMPGDGIRPRDIIVWLPPSYADAPEKRYPVLYMHDGQNVFDPRTSFLGADWQVDEVADSLMRTGEMEEIIIVGVNNSDDRRAEYSDTEKGRAYMKFLIEKLKPFIDATYRTQPERQNTAVMGSSMGGLISFLLAWHHPEVFSQAACLSPAFIPPFGSAVELVEKDEGPAKDLRLYLDNGGVALDSVLQAGCDQMLYALKQKGFRLGENLYWFHDQQAEHSERAWARRVWRPLLFMFKKREK